MTTLNFLNGDAVLLKKVLLHPSYHIKILICFCSSARKLLTWMTLNVFKNDFDVIGNDTHSRHPSCSKIW